MFKGEYREIKFFYSPLYFALLGGLSFILWLVDLITHGANGAVIGFTVLFVMLGVNFALCRDLSSTIIFPFIIPLAVYKTAMTSYGLYLYGIGVALLAVGVIIHLIRFRPFTQVFKTKPRLFTIGMLVFFVAIIISGITVHERATLAVLAITGVILLIMVASLANSVNLGIDGAERTLDLAIVAVITASLLASAQFVAQIATPETFTKFFAEKSLSGQASPNQYANLMARSLPVLFYLSAKKKKWSFLWVIPTFLMLGLIALTNSRATILFVAIFTVCAVVVCMIKTPRKIAWIVTFAVLCALAIGVIAIKGDLFKKIFSVTLDRKFSDSERFDVWALGWKRFTLYPIFGTGFDYDMSGIVHSRFSVYYYHNTLVQTLASMGIVGCFAFGFYMFSGTKTILDTKNVKAYVIGIILALIFVISLLDIHFYSPQSLWQEVTLVMCCYAIKPPKKETGPQPELS